MFAWLTWGNLSGSMGNWLDVMTVPLEWLIGIAIALWVAGWFIDKVVQARGRTNNGPNPTDTPK